jgi:hypothetical protein
MCLEQGRTALDCEKKTEEVGLSESEEIIGDVVVLNPCSADVFVLWRGRTCVMPRAVTLGLPIRRALEKKPSISALLLQNPV